MDHFDLLALSGNETLAKFAAFVVVQAQALVYLILSRSSAVFFSGGGVILSRSSAVFFSGAGAGTTASLFRRPAVERSESARRMAALLAAEMTPRRSGDAPPTPAGIQRRGRRSNDGGGDVDVDVELELMLIRCSFSS